MWRPGRWEGEPVLRRRRIVAGLLLLTLAAPLAAEAQQRPTVHPRIGWLVFGGPFSESSSGLEAALLQSLRALGYVDNKTLSIEYRYAEGQSRRLAELAYELARSKVDILAGIGVPCKGQDHPDCRRDEHGPGESSASSLARPGATVRHQASIDWSLARAGRELFDTTRYRRPRRGVPKRSSWFPVGSRPSLASASSMLRLGNESRSSPDGASLHRTGP